MSVIFLLIPLSVFIAACFLGAFIWAVRSGQYEDTVTPSLRVLWNDRQVPSPSESIKPGPDGVTPKQLNP